MCSDVASVIPEIVLSLCPAQYLHQVLTEPHLVMHGEGRGHRRRASEMPASADRYALGFRVERPVCGGWGPGACCLT